MINLVDSSPNMKNALQLNRNLLITFVLGAVYGLLLSPVSTYIFRYAFENDTFLSLGVLVAYARIDFLSFCAVLILFFPTMLAIKLAKCEKPLVFASVSAVFAYYFLQIYVSVVSQLINLNYYLGYCLIGVFAFLSAYALTRALNKLSPKVQTQAIIYMTVVLLVFHVMFTFFIPKISDRIYLSIHSQGNSIKYAATHLKFTPYQPTYKREGTTKYNVSLLYNKNIVDDPKAQSYVRIDSGIVTIHETEAALSQGFINFPNKCAIMPLEKYITYTEFDTLIYPGYKDNQAPPCKLVTTTTKGYRIYSEATQSSRDYRYFYSEIGNSLFVIRLTDLTSPQFRQREASDWTEDDIPLIVDSLKEMNTRALYENDYHFSHGL